MTLTQAAMDILTTLSKKYFPEATPVIPHDPVQPLSLDYISSANHDGLRKIEMFLPIEIAPNTSGVIIFKVH